MKLMRICIQKAILEARKVLSNRKDPNLTDRTMFLKNKNMMKAWINALILR